jgi:hypothetical protein
MTDLGLPKPWRAVEAEVARGIEQELARELCSGHVLTGVAVECLARREDCDDIVIRLRNHDSEFAIVHHTWNHETEPDWPWTTLFASADDLVANWQRVSD